MDIEQCVQPIFGFRDSNSDSGNITPQEDRIFLIYANLGKLPALDRFDHFVSPGQMGIDGLCSESVDISGGDDSFLLLLWINTYLVFLGLVVGLLIGKSPPVVKHIIPFPCRCSGIPAPIANYFHLPVLAETNT